MASEGWTGQLELAIAQLAHATLLLLAEGQPKTKFELGRFASDYSTEKARRLGQDTSLLTKRMANAALRYLAKSGFAYESKRKFAISRLCETALENNLDDFSILFVQRELTGHE